MLGDLGSDERRGAASRPPSGWSARACPEPLARAHALRPEQRYAPDMVWVAGATGRAIEDGRRGLLRGRRRAAPGLDGARARARPGDDADAALGAAGRARGRRPGPPRARGRRARRDRGRRRPQRGASRRTWPSAATRCAGSRAFLRSLVARGRAGPRGAHAGGPPAARARGLTPARWVGRRAGQVRRPCSGDGPERSWGSKLLGTGVREAVNLCGESSTRPRMSTVSLLGVKWITPRKKRVGRRAGQARRPCCIAWPASVGRGRDGLPGAV